MAKTKRPVAGKVVVVNFSGNVGKTTICNQVLAPRMGAQVFAVETINAAASDEAKGTELFKGKEFGTLSENILLSDRAIVDVGASTVEQFIHAMAKFEGSHEDFDIFIVPTTPEKKQQADTVNTIKALAGMGVGPERIVVVFNRVNYDDGASLETLFPALFALHAETGAFVLDRAATVYDSEIYDRLRALKKTVRELAEDATDYRALLREETDAEKKEKLVGLLTAQRLAKSAHKNLNAVYGAIFG